MVTFFCTMKSSQVAGLHERPLVDVTPDRQEELVVASVSSFSQPASQKTSPNATLGGRPNATRTRDFLLKKGGDGAPSPIKRLRFSKLTDSLRENLKALKALRRRGTPYPGKAEEHEANSRGDESDGDDTPSSSDSDDTPVSSDSDDSDDTLT